MSDAFRDELARALGSNYAIERELLGGGMSRVFVATEHSLNRRVVVKVLRPELAVDVNRERFRREIMLVAQMQHPHIVPVLNAAQHHELLWYTMPFIEGESLREEIRRGTRPAARDVSRVLHDVLDALDYAHARGIIHRDIKPGNILRHRAHSLVTDFGVAKALSAALPHSGSTSAGIAIGTPAYMAPEQLAADPRADHRLDLYAVGLLAYEYLTGTQPFAASSPQATMAAQLTRMPAPLSEVRPDIPAPLAALITRLLAKSPDDRPPTAAAALEELETITTPSTATKPAGWAIMGPPDRRRRRVFAALGSVLFVVAVAGVLLARRPTRSSDVPVVMAADTIGIARGPGATRPVPVADTTSGRASATPSQRVAAARGDTTISGAPIPGGSRMPRPSDSIRSPARPVPSSAVPRAGTKANATTTRARVTPVRRFATPRRVAVMPPRVPSNRPELESTARALADSLRRAVAAAGYELATDADLVRLLTQPGSQRRAADASNIGAIVTSDVQVRGGEIVVHGLVHDVWRNQHLSEQESTDLDKPLDALGIVRDMSRALDRVAWRSRSDPRAVIVFDVDNQTGQDSLDAVGRQIGDIVRRAIAGRLGGIVIGDSAARATKDVMERRQVGVRLGVGAIVATSMQRVRGDSVTVRLTARDMTEERNFETLEARIAVSALPGALETSLARLIESLGRVNWGPKAFQ